MTQLYTFLAFEKFNVDYSHTVYSREMILVHTPGIALSYKLKSYSIFLPSFAWLSCLQMSPLFSMGGGVSWLP